jgi:hypothetical protein
MLAAILMAALAAFAAIQLSACSGVTEEEAAGDEPASVEPIEGTDYNTITLSAAAVERVAIETAAVREKRIGGELKKVIPYTAVSYTPSGRPYVYTSPKERTYVRQPVGVEKVKEGLAILSHGPPVGTAVVTVGSPELFGAEYEFEPE